MTICSGRYAAVGATSPLTDGDTAAVGATSPLIDGDTAAVGATSPLTDGDTAAVGATSPLTDGDTAAVGATSPLTAVLVHTLLDMFLGLNVEPTITHKVPSFGFATGFIGRKNIDNDC